MDLNRLPEEGPSEGAGGRSRAAPVSESDVFCSICLDPANKTVEKTVVKLKCNHKFHLDCIGSAFNAKRVMECPNCRKLEKGDWRFSSGYAPIADHWNYEDEEDEEMIAQSYLPQMAVSVQWCPFNDVAPVPANFNGRNIFASNSTHASVHQWSGPFAPAEIQVHAPAPAPAPASAYAFQGIGAQYPGWERHNLPLATETREGHISRVELNSISSPASIHPFPAPQSVGSFYQGVQPGVHAVLPSLQQHYYQQQPYIAPLPNHPAETVSDPHGPVTGSGFHISSRYLGMGFFNHLPATPLQNFIDAGFPIPTAHLSNQGWEAAQPVESLSYRLNGYTQWPRQGHQTTWPNQP